MELLLCIHLLPSKLLRFWRLRSIGLSIGDISSIFRIGDSLLMKIEFLEATYPREGKPFHPMESVALTCSLDKGTTLSAPILGQGNAWLSFCTDSSIIIFSSVNLNETTPGISPILAVLHRSFSTLCDAHGAHLYVVPGKMWCASNYGHPSRFSSS